MKNFALSLILVLAPLCNLKAQGIPFNGNGMVHARSASYSGPGNVITSNAITWWGLRAYSAATRGNAVANVCIPADATCADLVTDATTGDLVIPTIGGSACSVVTCTVKTLYDQTGNNACNGGTPCDITQATIANRPVLTTSCLGSLPCMTWTAGQQLVFTGGIGTTFTQPYSTSVVGSRTGATSSYTVLLGMGDGSIDFGMGNAVNTSLMYSGGIDASVTVADNTTHAIQGLFSGTSSNYYLDGASNTTNPGTNSIQTSASFCMGACAQTLVGIVVEGGWWSTDKSANFSAMNSNQHAYWGF